MSIRLSAYICIATSLHFSLLVSCQQITQGLLSGQPRGSIFNKQKRELRCSTGCMMHAGGPTNNETYCRLRTRTTCIEPSQRNDIASSHSLHGRGADVGFGTPVADTGVCVCVCVLCHAMLCKSSL